MTVYYSSPDFIIRSLEVVDIAPLAAKEVAQGWSDTTDKHNKRIVDRADGKCNVLAAEYKGEVVGYISVYFDPPNTPFSGRGWCELVDFGVIEKCRCLGIGSKLMDIAESIASKLADTVYLGVGLHPGYGSAQRMYVKRGYIPDGSGAWYGNSRAVPYQNYPLDDDLIIYLTKRLK
ncbi:MAG: GNAT family N-acetyltransferase [Clostridiales bacterium]|nr:GNAT family N-acetyltransferase [Clostridiales bacterium]